ncbi:hypothetical protein G9A89_007364 [Geosiphon pyriformis]|nr:hypothetical protein G9A89_007364 [Geosiphon pyriformis]
MASLSAYEKQRLLNIEANQQILKKLGLEAPYQSSVPERQAKKQPIKKRYLKISQSTSRKAQKQSAEAAQAGANRRSNRLAKKANVISDDEYHQPAYKSTRIGKRNPKVFGHIPGIEIGTTWMMRIDCSRDGIHAPTVAGISGNEKEGAWSIALSGGYEDDIDWGEAFTYTGCGGRDLKGTKTKPKNLRTAPQSKNQTLTGLNLGLKVSCDTGRPIRVVRGYQVHSDYAPRSGYRYDGLYQVVRWWEDIGMSGFSVIKYAFKRLPGQPPLPIMSEDQDKEENEDEDEDQ